MKIGVAGFGTIGSKVVEYLLEKGFFLVSYNWRQIEQKKEKLQIAFDRKIQANKLTNNEYNEMKERILFTDNIIELTSCDIIIESLQENYDVKMNFYKSLKNSGLNNILATTTSCLSLDKLSESYDKTRFLGIHFFNPPTKMKLIELSFLKENTGTVKNKVFDFLNQLEDKKVIELPPIQGYIVNTILFANINFSINFHISSGISVENIDEAMRLGTNVPMGPFELSDYVGNDVSLQILEELYSCTGDIVYKPSALIKEMVNKNLLGRKTKEGFYKY